MSVTSPVEWQEETVPVLLYPTRPPTLGPPPVILPAEEHEVMLPPLLDPTNPPTLESVATISPGEEPPMPVTSAVEWQEEIVPSLLPPALLRISTQSPYRPSCTR